MFHYQLNSFLQQNALVIALKNTQCTTTSLLLSACLSMTSCHVLTKLPTVLESADTARKTGDFRAAVTLYKQHMQERLATRWKIRDENAYFWLLTVGDVYLESGDPEEAREAYDQARIHNVDRNLLVDRYLTLATWYKDLGNVRKAVSILEEYRSLDPLLFNGTLDSISKEFVAQEDAE